MLKLLQELRKRSVIRVAGTYAVVGWLLAQIAVTLESSLNLPGWFDTAIVTTLLLGFPVALVVAWAFELTPDGLRRTKASDVEAKRQPANVLDFAITGAVLLVIGMISWQLTTTDGARTTPEEDPSTLEQSQLDDRSIAVLPFADLSPNSDQGYFADGLTEEILNSLSRVPELRVTARTSAFAFKDASMPVPEIAKVLGVSHVLEGSVRRSDDRLRISAQLIRAEDGTQLWSDTFDGTLEDVFLMQETIGESVADALDIVLDEEKREAMIAYGTRDAIAFDHFQRGQALQRDWHRTFLGEEIWIANDWFERSLEHDPEFARAYLQMTDPYVHHFFGQIPLREEEATEQARAYLDELYLKSVEFANDEEIRLQHQVNQIFLSDDWRRFKSVVQDYARVAKDSRRPYDPLWDAEALMLFGEYDALETIIEQRMIALDPLNAAGYSWLARMHLMRNDLTEAREALERMNSIRGLNRSEPMGLYLAFSESGHDGMANWGELNAAPTHPVARLFFQAQKTYETDSREAAIDFVANSERGQNTPGMKAAALATLGDRQGALRQLALIEDDSVSVAGHALLVANGVYCTAKFVPLTEKIRLRFERAEFALPQCVGASEHALPPLGE